MSERAIVRRAHTPAGPAGWDILIVSSTGAIEWADRVATRDEARDQARAWNAETARAVAE